MDISVFVILYLLFSHWVADFLFQTTHMGTYKSKSNKVLLLHTATYTLVMFLVLGVGGHLCNAEFITVRFLWFFPISFVAHTVQDYVTSRLTSMQFAANKYNGIDGAFTIIGIDQFLHYCQIFLTYLFLTQF